MCTCSINWSSVSVPSWLEQMRQSPKALMTVVLLMCEAPLCLWDKPSLSLPLGTTTLFPHFRWKKVKSLQRVILARVTLLIFLQLGLGPNLSDFRLWMFFPPASVPPWWYRMARLVVPHQGKGDTAPFPDRSYWYLYIFKISNTLSILRPGLFVHSESTVSNFISFNQKFKIDTYCTWTHVIHSTTTNKALQPNPSRKAIGFQ